MSSRLRVIVKHLQASMPMETAPVTTKNETSMKDTCDNGSCDGGEGGEDHGPWRNLRVVDD